MTYSYYICMFDNTVMDNKKIRGKSLLKFILWFVAIWAILLATLQLTLSERVLTRIVNKYAAEYIDGELSFGSASVSMFKHFPRVFITLEDFHITYPSERFDAAEESGVKGRHLYAGCGETADTLASFDRFSASINVASLVNGTLRIPHLRLVHPRIFTHIYANGESNLDILNLGSEDTEEESAPLPLPSHLSVGRISFSRHPHIVYTNSKDTVFAMVDVARIGFNGQLQASAKAPRGRQPKFTPRNTTKGLTVDSLIVAGRIKKDTVGFVLNRLYVQEEDSYMGIDAKARAMLATRSFGRVHLPIDITGKLDFPKDTVPAVTLNDFKANVGDFPIVADADIRFMKEKAAVKTRIGIEDCRLNDVFHGFAKNIIPELDNVETDARLTITAECDGDYIYRTGAFPQLTASISIPEAALSYSELDKFQMKFGISAKGQTDERGRMNALLDHASMTADGLNLNISGSATDLLGNDPAIGINGNLYVSLDTLVRVLPDSLDITADGDITAKINGNALLSQMSIYNFSRADIIGNVNSDKIIVQMPSDSLYVNIKGLDITIAPEERVSRRDSTRVFRLAGVTAKVKHGIIDAGSALHAQTFNLMVSAKNSVNTEDLADTSVRINPLSGRLNAGILSIRDGAGMAISLDETKNSFMLRPKKDKPEIPVLSLRSQNTKLTISQDKSRAILSDANFKANAEMNTFDESRPRRMDSLQRQAFIQRARESEPEWMKEEDFRKQDIDIRLDETLAKYFREWNLNGQLSVGKGNIVTPYFPLNSSIRGFELNFTNNEIKIDSFKVVAGKSEIEAKGSLTGLKRAMLGRTNRSRLKLNLDISSGKMNASELMAAYQKGMTYNPQKETEEEVTDTTMSSLIVIPANLDANINLNATDARYDELVADRVTANIVMKERCVQITETKAHTNIGEMSFNAFYSTRTKQDLKAGFDLSFKDITAEKAISLMPAMDTLVPMLKSFSGKFNCDVTATASLDTNMNLVMPSVNGILRISGSELTIRENEMYTSLARKFMLKDKKEGHIDNMKLEAVIQDNMLEIFPFVFSMDRYTIAMSGVQNMDMSYKYHASVIKSPLPVRLGIDVYGQDFDNMKFKIGKAKYKSSEVPAFSAVIDQTRINLREAIENIFDKGVDATINESIRQTAILDHKQKIKYVRAVDMEIVELSGQEQKQMEEAEETIDSEEKISE